MLLGGYSPFSYKISAQDELDIKIVTPDYKARIAEITTEPVTDPSVPDKLIWSMGVWVWSRIGIQKVNIRLLSDNLQQAVFYLTEELDKRYGKK